MKLLRPDEISPSVRAIDYERLWHRGIRALLFDLDNTLVLWRKGPPDQETKDLLCDLRERGFRIAVLSNGRLSLRPDVLNTFEELGIPVIWPARKPLGCGIRKALRGVAANPGEVALIGDQIFTDILGAKRLGIYAILVPPLSFREHPWTKVNRFFERIIGCLMQLTDHRLRITDSKP